MKKKMKKFAEGGFSKEQEEWLGGADRADPYILARMRSAVPDEVIAAPKKSMEQVQDEQEGYESAVQKTPKSIERTVVKTKIEPAKSDKEKPTKKPYIDIPEGAAGMSQYRTDAVSPMEKLFKSISGKSQRTTAAEKKMATGGSVKSSSASRRGDGCCVKGKTKGRMV